MDQQQRRIFSSWKEIAAFLGKGVRTVQRWEKTLGLPVSRPNGLASNVVVASEEDLINWCKKIVHPPVIRGINETSPQLFEIRQGLARLEETHQRLQQSL